MKIRRGTIVFVGLALAAGLVAGFVVRSVEMLSPEAPVVFDRSLRTYASWLCVKADAVETQYLNNRFSAFDPDGGRSDLAWGVEELPLAEARRRRAKPDEACKRAGGFYRERPLLLAVLGL